MFSENVDRNLRIAKWHNAIINPERTIGGPSFRVKVKDTHYPESNLYGVLVLHTKDNPINGTNSRGKKIPHYSGTSARLLIPLDTAKSDEDFLVYNPFFDQAAMRNVRLNGSNGNDGARREGNKLLGIGDPTFDSIRDGTAKNQGFEIDVVDPTNPQFSNVICVNFSPSNKSAVLTRDAISAADHFYDMFNTAFPKAKLEPFV